MSSARRIDDSEAGDKASKLKRPMSVPVSRKAGTRTPLQWKPRVKAHGV